MKTHKIAIGAFTLWSVLAIPASADEFDLPKPVPSQIPSHPETAGTISLSYGAVTTTDGPAPLDGPISPVNHQIILEMVYHGANERVDEKGTRVGLFWMRAKGALQPGSFQQQVEGDLMPWLPMAELQLIPVTVAIEEDRNSPLLIGTFSFGDVLASRNLQLNNQGRLRINLLRVNGGFISKDQLHFFIGGMELISGNIQLRTEKLENSLYATRPVFIGEAARFFLNFSTGIPIGDMFAVRLSGGTAFSIIATGYDAKAWSQLSFGFKQSEADRFINRPAFGDHFMSPDLFSIRGEVRQVVGYSYRPDGSLASTRAEFRLETGMGWRF